MIYYTPTTPQQPTTPPNNYPTTPHHTDNKFRKIVYIGDMLRQNPEADMQAPFTPKTPVRQGIEGKLRDMLSFVKIEKFFYKDLQFVTYGGNPCGRRLFGCQGLMVD